jgi:hypothetical protein
MHSQQFWDEAKRLTSTTPKRCEMCCVADGDDISKGPRPKRTTHAVVRLALRQGAEITAGNLGLFCTRCRPEPRSSRKLTQLDALLQKSLFEVEA